MPRWKPNAPDRLARAALELFAERGYDNTTVADIARRAGLGKSTFFRLYADKREVLFGDDRIERLLVEAVATAPATATALEAVGLALEAAAREIFTADRRAFVAARRSVIDTSTELQEREALKQARLLEAIAAALERRGTTGAVARAAAHACALATESALRGWLASDQDFASSARSALTEVQAAMRSLGAGA